MMKRDEGIWKKNLDALKAGYPKEAEKLQEYLEDKNYQPKVIVEEVPNYDGNISLQITSVENKRTLILDRIFGQKETNQKLIDGWGKIMDHSPFLILGMGNMENVRDYLKAAPENCLMVLYEPSIDVFLYVMEHIDISDIIMDAPVMFIIEGLTKENMKDKISRLFYVETAPMMKLVANSNYYAFFEEEMKKIMKMASDCYHTMIVNWLTAIKFSDVNGSNMMVNLNHMYHCRAVNQLDNMLKGEIPAIIVSAGPSLNKNIKELKKAQGRACIIATDTALKPCFNHGVKPDFVIIIDGKKPMSLMKHERLSEVPLVTSLVAANGINDMHKGMKIFYSSEEHFESALITKCGEKACNYKKIYIDLLATGGSVANSAFSMARLMKPSKIILIGQDLAFTGGKTHADGTFKKKMDHISKEEEADLYPVESVDGGIVYTRADYGRYLNWFEDEIKSKNIKNVVDATEGGALIHGTKVMTLKKAIRKYCTKEFEVQKRLDEIPELFDYGAKSEFLKIYNALPKNLGKVEKMASKALKAYIKLEKLAKTENSDAKELKKVYDNLTKINKFMNDDPYALFVQSNDVKLDFTIRNSIYMTEEDPIEEQISIAKNGQIMSLSIRNEAYRWKEACKKILDIRPLELSKEDVKSPLDQLLYELRRGEA